MNCHWFVSARLQLILVARPFGLSWPKCPVPSSSRISVGGKRDLASINFTLSRRITVSVWMPSSYLDPPSRFHSFPCPQEIGGPESWFLLSRTTSVSHASGPNIPDIGDPVFGFDMIFSSTLMHKLSRKSSPIQGCDCRICRHTRCSFCGHFRVEVPYENPISNWVIHRRSLVK